MIRTATRLTLLCLLALAGLLATSGVASAKAPCWKLLINDWYDGHIDSVYPIHCYRDAIKHLPPDVETYSSAADDIRQAMAARVEQLASKRHETQRPTKQPAKKRGTDTTSVPPATHSGGSSGGSSGGGTTKPSGSSGGQVRAQGAPPILDAQSATARGRQKPAGISGVLSEGSDSADSLPIPLLVLGSLAILLLVLGTTGFLYRRLQQRRAQIGPTSQPAPQPIQKRS